MRAYIKNVATAAKTLLACMFGYTVATQTQQGKIWVRYCFTYKQALAITRLQAAVSATTAIYLRGSLVAGATKQCNRVNTLTSY